MREAMADQRSETNELGASDYHGDSGPLNVSNVPTPHPLTKTYIEAA